MGKLDVATGMRLKQRVEKEWMIWEDFEVRKCYVNNAEAAVHSYPLDVPVTGKPNFYSIYAFSTKDDWQNIADLETEADALILEIVIKELVKVCQRG